ncbi:MAG: endolytic transglycosylase MltG [Rhodobacteraceae bacterium]|nr:endolytic transglycosylase MltG [Paracoccaceae bacterium]
MARHFAANFVNFLILLLLGVGVAVFWGQSEFKKAGPLRNSIFIEVPRGGNIRGVSEDLAEKGAISNAMVMRLGAKYTQKSAALKYGNYEIPAGASMVEILDIVTKGGRSTFRFVATYRINIGGSTLVLAERDADSGTLNEMLRFKAGEEIPVAYRDLVAARTPINYRVTVVEGATSWQVVDGLKKADFLGESIVTIPGEGLLAPDSYDVRRGALQSEVLDLMLQAQTRILAQEWDARAEGLPLTSMDEALTLASIVEKETGVSSEREEVAAVFVNRLNKKMKLQTDPTVIYGITKGEGVLGRGLRRSELLKKTPYNTYIIKALPPTPIANPGRAAIHAALHPNASNNLFFVADGTGGHAFAETLVAHNRNVIKWRKIEAKRRKEAQKKKK